MVCASGAARSDSRSNRSDKADLRLSRRRADRHWASHKEACAADTVVTDGCEVHALACSPIARQHGAFNVPVSQILTLAAQSCVCSQDPSTMGGSACSTHNGNKRMYRIWYWAKFDPE